MPWLQSVFCILKHKLGIPSKISSHDCSLEISTATSGVVWDAAKGKYPRDLEVVSKFKRCVCWDEGHTIDSISLLAINYWSRVCKPDRPSNVDQSIMIRALGIRPRSTCRQIPPEFDIEHVKKISKHKKISVLERISVAYDFMFLVVIRLSFERSIFLDIMLDIMFQFLHIKEFETPEFDSK